MIVSFASPVKISGINVSVEAASAADAAVAYKIEYSVDGTTFVGFSPAVAGPGSANLVIPFPATVMKAIKMTQTGMSAGAWWSISEITFTGCVQQ